jgi:hypothetical protein
LIGGRPGLDPIEKEYPENPIYRRDTRALHRLLEHGYLLPERQIFKAQLAAGFK